MYAIVQQGGHQYRVAPGDRLLVDQLDAPVGTVVALQPVLLVQDDAGATVGTPTVDGVRIAALVVSHRLGGKIRVFKYKPKKHYRRTHGHRSRLTELRVEALVAAGDPLPEPPDAAVTPGPEVAAPAEPAAKPARTRRTARPKAAAAEPPEAGTAEAAAVEEAVEESRAEAAEAEAEPVQAPKPAARRGPRAAKPKASETSTEAPAPDTES